MTKTDYVLGFHFRDRNTVALIRKKRPEWQAGKLNGIGGKVEKGEAPLLAMRREFFEETGARVRKWRNFALVSGLEYRLHCFTASGDELLKTTTDEEVIWANLLDPKAWEQMIPNLNWLIPLAGDKDAPFAVVAAK